MDPGWLDKTLTWQTNNLGGAQSNENIGEIRKVQNAKDLAKNENVDRTCESKQHKKSVQSRCTISRVTNG